ncbi:ArsR/SmtB family transcription factor [Leptospira sp. WS92.C1]
MVQQETTFEDHLSLTFAALADPTRRKILATLRYGDVTVKQLAEPFAMSLPAITKHLKVLEKAGLISRGKEAQWRPSRLEAGPLKEVADWIDGYRQIWEARLDRLDEYLRELQQQEKEKTQNQRKSDYEQGKN